MIDFAKELNPEQFTAATAPDGPMLVLAAAGTGKTRTLVHRVAYLVEQGVPPQNILLLTFTNRAAREMIERAGELVPGLDGIWSGTFHSICARLLRQYGNYIGWSPAFTIIDDDDQKKLMTEAIKEKVKDPSDFLKREVLLSILSDCANRQMDLEPHVYSLQTKIACDPPLVLEVLNEYVKRKRDLNVMDFDDLLVNGLRLLNDAPEVREVLQEHFRYVLVDEYQDTNSIQAQFTDILAARHRNIMVVGDDFQCIYTWRGAQYENIMNFPDRWPGCRTVKLERNYRSFAPILSLANSVMANVQHKFDKTLRPFRKPQGGEAPLPKLYRVANGRAQAELILKVIRALPTIGVNLSDVAILYRSHYTSIDIQFELTRNGIPFEITSGIGVFEQMHVKDTLSFLRLCIDSSAKLSFFRVFNLLPGVGDGLCNKLWTKLEGSFDINNPFSISLINDLMCKRGKPAWEKLRAAFNEARQVLADTGETNAGVIISEFCDWFYTEHLQQMFKEDDAESRLQDVLELEVQINASGKSLREFLNEVALMTNLDAEAKRSLPADRLTLTTVHQSKGMEWPVVILPWVNQTIFPTGRSIENNDIEEERRLFYVAVTRARNRLYMSAPLTKRLADGSEMPVPLSCFLADVPDSLIDVQKLCPDRPSFPHWSDTPTYRRPGKPSNKSGFTTTWYK